MIQSIGQKLIRNGAVTEDQLHQALQRQRLRGGRLGNNLVALGFLSPKDLDVFFNPAPRCPKNVEETGLDLAFLSELTLKHICHMGEFRLQDLSDRLRLPTSIADQAVEVLRREKMVEVRGASEYLKTSFKFNVTDGGKTKASELMDICSYAGPAPITLEMYREMVELQTIKNITINDDAVRKAFSDLVIDENLIKRLGPAISSGNPMFIYGPPGNGKTTIAETIGKVLPDTVYIPHALYVGGQIITVFDPVTHVEDRSGETENGVDLRWHRVKRPVIVTGGELTLKTLDLEFNSIAKFYEAPLQMKANNGMFIVDDFGRQQMDPQALLNRWIVNLDRSIDFMSLHTGMKFEIPFNQLVVFATNLEPKSLVDEAFLRRIRYKIKVDHPTQEEYELIFKRVCSSNGVAFDEFVFDFLVKHYYRRLGVPFNACHPRDIIDQVIDESRYYNIPPELSKSAIEKAWENYFIES